MSRRRSTPVTATPVVCAGQVKLPGFDLPAAPDTPVASAHPSARFDDDAVRAQVADVLTALVSGDTTISAATSELVDLLRTH